MKKKMILLACSLLLVSATITGCHKKEVIRTVANQQGVEFNKDVIRISPDTYYREKHTFIFPKTEETSEMSEGTDFQCDTLHGKFFALEVDRGLFNVKVEADELYNSPKEPDVILPSNLKFEHEVEVVMDKNKETKRIKKDKVFVLPEMKACYKAEKVKKGGKLLKVKVSELSDMELMAVISSINVGEM